MDDAIQVVTPTTEMVYEIALYGALNAAEDVSDQLDNEEFREMFDRWLQEVKAEAWNEGAQKVRSATIDEAQAGMDYWLAENPYRTHNDRP